MTATDNGSPERKISRGVVAIYKEYTGRGPTTAQTTISDLCSTTIIQDSLTKAERLLVASGEAPTVREIRRKFQETMRPEIEALVADATGRKTSTLLSDHHAEDDVAIETVMFAVEVVGEPEQVHEPE